MYLWFGRKNLGGEMLRVFWGWVVWVVLFFSMVFIVMEIFLIIFCSWCCIWIECVVFVLFGFNFWFWEILLLCCFCLSELFVYFCLLFLIFCRLGCFGLFFIIVKGCIGFCWLCLFWLWLMYFWKCNYLIFWVNWWIGLVFMIVLCFCNRKVDN